GLPSPQGPGRHGFSETRSACGPSCALRGSPARRGHFVREAAYWVSRAEVPGLLLAARSWVLLVTWSRRPMLLSRERRRDASTTDASRGRCTRPKGTSAALARARYIPRVDRADDVVHHVQGDACRGGSLLGCLITCRRERGTRTQSARIPLSRGAPRRRRPRVNSRGPRHDALLPVETPSSRFATAP